MWKPPVVIAVTYWLFDTVIEFLFLGCSFWAAVVGPDMRSLSSRIVVACLMVVLIGLLHLRLKKRITEREELIESQKLYRLLAENVTDVIWTMDLNLRYSYVSPSIERVRGYKPEELVGKRLDEVVFPGWYRRAKELLKEELARDANSDPQRSRMVEMPLPCKDGSIMWAEIKVSFLRDEKGKPVGILGVSRDVTERRKVEAELRRHKERLDELVRERTRELMETNERLREYQARLKRLANELTLVEERERRRIAVELHDNLAQMLAVVKMRLSALTKCAEDERRKILEEVRSLIDRSIEFTRSLTVELSPPVLYELGLESAVEWLVERIKKEHSVNIQLNLPESPKPVEERTRVLLFKAVRELLFNVIKHAKARHVGVVVDYEDGFVRVVVEDDGVGFDPGTSCERDGFGLFSIKERLDHIGGRMEIDSSPGRGTKVVLVAPVSDREVGDGGEDSAGRRPQDSERRIESVT